MAATQHLKPTRIPPPKRQRRYRIPTIEAGRTPAAGLAAFEVQPIVFERPEYVTFDCKTPMRSDVGANIRDGRRCIYQFKLLKLAPQSFIVIPVFMRVVNDGRNLLRDRLNPGQAIPGTFPNLLAAADAAEAFAAFLNVVVDG